MAATIEFNRVSLLDRIKTAESNDELLALKTEGSGYEYASINTQGKLEKASTARRAELRKASEKPTEEPKPKQRAKTDKKGAKEKNK